MAQILLTQGAEAPTPPSGVTSIYTKVDGLVYSKAPSGVETPLSGGGGGGSGVVSVSVVTANGFGGTVTSPTTFPAITLTTSLTGLLKGTGTALAVAGVADLPVMTNLLAGIVPTPPNNASQFLNGLGAWTTPPSNVGTVTSFIFTNANGITGSVSTATSTPTLTLGTGLSGLVKGNGTAFVVASNSDLPSMSATVGGATPTPPNDASYYLNGTGVWSIPPGGGGGGGTVTSFAFTNANGFTGTVSASTSNPTLSLGTSITGILKGNGTAVSAATGSDLPVMTASVGGAVPTPPNNTTTFLRGDGTFATPPSGSGTVTSVSVTTANGVSGSVATSTTTPAITLTLGNITPSKVNGNTITTGTGVLTLGAGKTLTASNSITLAGTDSTTMTFPPASANVGYLEVPQNSQSAAYTLVSTDSAKHVYHPSADTTARTYTIPANSSVAYPIGTALTFINDTGAGVITIAINTDTMVLAGAGTTGSRTLAANGMATAIKVTATRWMISGTGLT